MPKVYICLPESIYLSGDKYLFVRPQVAICSRLSSILIRGDSNRTLTLSLGMEPEDDGVLIISLSLCMAANNKNAFSH